VQKIYFVESEHRCTQIIHPCTSVFICVRYSPIFCSLNSSHRPIIFGKMNTDKPMDAERLLVNNSSECTLDISYQLS